MLWIVFNAITREPFGSTARIMIINATNYEICMFDELRAFAEQIWDYQCSLKS